MPAEHHGDGILLVDDDADHREPVMLLLRAHGHAVTGAADGQEALEFLAAGLQPCLIVLDITMPRMGGLEFMRRHHDPAAPALRCAPVILYSSGADLPRQAREAGAVTHVQKPDLDRLLRVVARFC